MTINSHYQKQTTPTVSSIALKSSIQLKTSNQLTERYLAIKDV